MSDYIDMDMRQLASEALQKALVAEKMKQKDAAVHLGIHITYVSLIYHGDEQKRCSMDAWERVIEWANTGKTLKESNYEAIPLLTKAAFKRTPGKVNYPESHYSAGKNGNDHKGKMFSLDDVIDKAIEGLLKAQEYGIAQNKWKKFIKDIYFKKQKS